MIGPCYYCGRVLPLCIDHRKAKARGGSDTARNCKRACWDCNSSKGARTVAQWRETIARWSLDCPYFIPDQVGFMKSRGLNLVALIRDHAKLVRFAFEGGDCKIVREYLTRDRAHAERRGGSAPFKKYEPSLVLVIGED